MLRFLVRLLKKYFWSDLRDGLSELCSWQTLGAIGRSNIGRITILVPFIGYLVIFNPTFVEFFQTVVPSGSNLAPDIVLQSHSARLYFLYFGLLSLGLGIVLFSGFCPDPVRRYTVVSEYVSEMEAVASNSLILDRFNDIVVTFLSRNRGESASPFFSGQHPSFPNRPSYFLHDLIANIVCEIPHEERMLPKSPEPMGSLFTNSRHAISSGEGFITTDEVMRRIFESGITAEMMYIHRVNDEAVKFSKQIFFLDYLSSNYSRFYTRVFVMLLFVVGLSLLAIPTLTTSILVLNSAFSGGAL